MPAKLFTSGRVPSNIMLKAEVRNSTSRFTEKLEMLGYVKT